MDENKITRNSPEVNDKVNDIISLLWWCHENKIPYRSIRQLAEASYEMASGEDVWECGYEEKSTNEKAQEEINAAV